MMQIIDHLVLDVAVFSNWDFLVEFVFKASVMQSAKLPASPISLVRNINLYFTLAETSFFSAMVSPSNPNSGLYFPRGTSLKM
jgi:hypothetical protein